MSTYQQHQFDRRFHSQLGNNGYYTFYPQLPSENPESMLNPFQSSNQQPVEYQPFLAQEAHGYASLNSDNNSSNTSSNRRSRERSNSEGSGEEDDSASSVLKVSMGHFLVILLHCIVLSIILAGYYFQYVTLTSVFIAITLLSAYFVIPITCTGFVVVPGISTSIICIFISIAMCAVFLSDPLWRISYFDNYLKGVEDVRVVDIPKLYEPRVHPPADEDAKEQPNEYFRWRNGKMDLSHYGVLEKPNVDRYYFVVPLVDESFDPEHDSVQVVLAKTIYNKLPLGEVFDLELPEGWRVANSALNRWDLFTDRSKYYQKAIGNMKSKFEGEIRFAHNLIVLEQQEQSLKDMYTFYHQLCRIGVILVGIILGIQLLCMIAEVSFRFGISIGLLRRQEAAESS